MPYHRRRILSRKFSVRAIIITIFVMFALLIAAGVTNGQTLSGNATRWLDADTIDFRASSGKYYRVRFRGIDSPELRQTHGKECRDLLRSETLGKRIYFVRGEQDVYSRYVSKIWSDTIPDFSLWLIQNGCAWEYSAPLSVKSAYQAAEATARDGAIGLWLDECPTEPWAFRASGYNVCP